MLFIPLVVVPRMELIDECSLCGSIAMYHCCACGRPVCISCYDREARLCSTCARTTAASSEDEEEDPYLSEGSYLGKWVPEHPLIQHYILTKFEFILDQAVKFEYIGIRDHRRIEHDVPLSDITNINGTILHRDASILGISHKLLYMCMEMGPHGYKDRRQVP